MQELYQAKISTYYTIISRTKFPNVVRSPQPRKQYLAHSFDFELRDMNALLV